PLFRCNTATATLLEAVAVTLCVAGFAATATIENWAGDYPWLGWGGVLWLRQTGLALPGFALLVLVTALGRGWLARVLSATALVTLGEASYSLYLIHQPLLIFYKAQHNAGAFQSVPNWIAYGVFWVVALLMAHLIWRLYERPARSLLIG